MRSTGIINVNKPAGLTSHDVVAKLRKRLRIKKVGHTGTLDPMATGVLPICFGTATRIIEYYDCDTKAYIAEMKLGITTDTLDITGEVLHVCDAGSVDVDALSAAFGKMTGWVSQTPPKYSAIKVGGKRLYEYAREGKEVDIKERKIYIDSINVLEFDADEHVVRFEVLCSKGTYIRTICDDIGRTLGCGACMTALVRTRSGAFDIESAHDLDDIINMSDDELEEVIIEMDDTLHNLGRVEIPDYRRSAFLNGLSTSFVKTRVLDEPKENLHSDKAEWFETLYAAYDTRGNFLGVASLCDGELKPDKIIRGK